jgi:hypothetical protein
MNVFPIVRPTPCRCADGDEIAGEPDAETGPSRER